jgi:hypothetical protein
VGAPGCLGCGDPQAPLHLAPCCSRELGPPRPAPSAARTRNINRNKLPGQSGVFATDDPLVHGINNVRRGGRPGAGDTGRGTPDASPRPSVRPARGLLTQEPAWISRIPAGEAVAPKARKRHSTRSPCPRLHPEGASALYGPSYFPTWTSSFTH